MSSGVGSELRVGVDQNTGSSMDRDHRFVVIRLASERYSETISNLTSTAIVPVGHRVRHSTVVQAKPNPAVTRTDSRHRIRRRTFQGKGSKSKQYAVSWVSNEIPITKTLKQRVQYPVPERTQYGWKTTETLGAGCRQQPAETEKRRYRPTIGKIRFVPTSTIVNQQGTGYSIIRSPIGSFETPLHQGCRQTLETDQFRVTKGDNEKTHHWRCRQTPGANNYTPRTGKSEGAPRNSELIAANSRSKRGRCPAVHSSQCGSSTAPVAHCWRDYNRNRNIASANFNRYWRITPYIAHRRKSNLPVPATAHRGPLPATTRDSLSTRLPTKPRRYPDLDGARSNRPVSGARSNRPSLESGNPDVMFLQAAKKR